MECDDVPGGDDSGAVAWRNFVCGIWRTVGGVCDRNGDGAGRAAIDVPDQDAAAGATARAGIVEDGIGGTAFYLAREINPGRHFPGFVRGVAGRRSSAAAGVCSRNFAYRAVGVGIAANRARSGSGDYGSGIGASPAAGKGGAGAAVVG